MRLDWRGVAMLACAAVGLAALLVLIILRGPIAETAIRRTLAWNDVDAALELAVFDFDRAVVDGLRVGPSERPAVTVRRIEARYGLWGLIRGQPRSLAVEGLEIRVTIDGRGARLEGLPLRAGGGRRGRPPILPEITVADARVVVDTPAGELVGDLDIAGGPKDGWTARFSIPPGMHSSETAKLELAEAALSASVTGDVLALQGDFRLERLSAGGASVDEAAVSLDFTGKYADAARLDGLTGQGELVASLGAMIEPELAASWAGRLAPDVRGPVGDLLGAHLDALRSGVEEALREVAGQSTFSIAVAEGRATAKPVGTPSLAGSGDARLVLASTTDVGGALVYDSRSGQVGAHDLSLAGSLPGDIAAEAVVRSATVRPDRDGLSGDATVALDLAPWTADDGAGELTLSAEAPQMRLEGDDGAWTAAIAAQLHASGARHGVTVSGAVLNLDLEAGLGRAGVVVRPRTESPQTLQAEWVAAGGRLFEQVQAGIAPLQQGGPLFRADAGAMRIETRLLGAGAGFEALGGRWALLLPASELTAEQPSGGAPTLTVYIQAPRLDGRFPDGAATAQASVIEGQWAPATAARLRFAELSFNGAAAPFRLEHAAGELEASLVDGKVMGGRLTLVGAELTDAAERARLTPVTVGGDAPIADGVLAGAFRAVDRTGLEILRADVRHDFAAGAGALTFVTPLLTFGPELQPSAIFPALRGPIVNVAGAARAQARLQWDPAGLQSEGLIELDGLSFDTALGHVGGVSTRFEVADLLAFRTETPQRIDIALIDPGLPLAGGAVEVELLGPARVGLASASFPFAGGVISAEPAEIDLTADRHRVVLLAQGLSLDTLDATLDPPGLDMTGSLSGRIPLEAEGRSVLIAGGALFSDGPGRVAYTGPVAQGIANQNESTKLAFDALKSFEYDRLSVGLDGDVAGRLDLKVSLDGRNPDVLYGQRIVFNLNTSAEFANLITNAFSGLRLSAVRRPEGEESAPSSPADAAPGDAAAPEQ